MSKAIMPGEVSGGGKKGKRRGKRRGGKRSLSGRLGAAKGNLASLGVFMGEVAGSATIASAAKGYLGDRMNIIKDQPLTDGRLAVAALGVGLKAFGKTGSYDHIVTNVTTGVLTSWLSERGFDFGAKVAGPAVTATPAAEGVVIGNVYDEAGLFGSSPEKRLERKLAKLKKKAEKKGVDWSEVRDADKSKKAMKIMSDLEGNDEPDDGDGPPARRRIPAYAAYGGDGRGGLPPRAFVGAPVRRPFFRRPLARRW